MRTVDEFWDSVDRTGGPVACWPWMGDVTVTTGYGSAFVPEGVPCRTPSTNYSTAHRVAWAITHGPIPTHVSPTGRVHSDRVRHKCPGGPNRLCCNPLHLRLGTDKDNADDRAADGHTFRGEQVTISKLTESSVRAALLAHANGESINSLAKRYGVEKSTMAPALFGDTWAHVAPEIERPKRGKPVPRKLTSKDVVDIRSAHSAGKSMYSLAKAYNVTHGCVQKIVHRKTWKDVA